MGYTIRATAAADDILADTRNAHDAAVARGGVVLRLADQTITPVLAVVDNVGAQIKKVDAQAKPASRRSTSRTVTPTISSTRRVTTSGTPSAVPGPTRTTPCWCPAARASTSTAT